VQAVAHDRGDDRLHVLGQHLAAPSIIAHDCAARRIATPARGERPCVKRGEWRV
jgi:hypothetical protein